jgi:ubiquitin C-terminal hydrolase
MNNNNGKNGLINIGNTCFINSSIQCLNFTNLLTLYILNKDLQDNTIAFEWRKLLETLWKGNGCIAPNRFIHYIFKNTYFIKGEQNDCSEYIRVFLDNMNTCLSIHRSLQMNLDNITNENYIKVYKNSVDNWNRNFKNKSSIISELFYGQTITQIICENCKKITHNFEVFNDIILSIDNDTHTIYDCLKKNFDPEVLNTTSDNIWKCDKCNVCSKSKKVHYIWKIPKILIISFKRYDKDLKKLHNLINFPLDNLNILRYCKGIYNNTPIYNLYSVINHYGDFYGGHYNAFCQHPDTNWYEFDDASVKQIDTKDIITEYSYCLFYKLQNSNS